MMNVAQVLCSGSFGGAEAVACSLAKALQPVVDRSSLYLIQELRAGQAACARLVQRVQQFDIDLRLFETRERFSTRLLHQLRTAVTEDRVDVVHSHSYKAAFFTALARGPLRRSPGATLFTIHGLEQQQLKHRLFEKGVNALGAYLSDVLIGVSQRISEQYRALPFLATRVRTIPNALVAGATEPLQALRAGREACRARLAARFAVRLDVPWVAIVGRLVPVKNHALFLDTVEAVAAAGSHQAHFFIVGDGPLREPLQQRVAGSAALAARVTLTGHLDDIASVYSAVDLSMLTSDSEGSPMVVLEAMSYGLPVVCSAVGGVPDIVADNVDGLLFPAGDRALCSERLARLLADEDLRQRMGAAGHAKAHTEYHPAAWARRHRALYQTLAG